MTYSNRQCKNFKIQPDWDLFKKSRNDSFHAIKEAKKRLWTNFLNNAKKNEVFQTYKYTKSRSVEKLSFISHNGKIKNHFEEKCDALIETVFSLSFENIQKRSSIDPLDEINHFENR